jgi:hypothetical protein
VSYAIARSRRTNGEINKLFPEDRAAHEWYRFVLSFPPHLVRDYAHRFGLGAGDRLLDPFCGTGTTLVEGRKLGLAPVGLEATPIGAFASRVKTDWGVHPDRMLDGARLAADRTLERLQRDGLEDDLMFRLRVADGPALELRTLAPEAEKLLLAGSISPVPLHKTLVLLEELDALREEAYYGHLRLALARGLVQAIGNLHFGPEVGVGKPKADAPVVASWLQRVAAMADDLRLLGRHAAPPATVHRADARDPAAVLGLGCIDAVITSPPYPNEKDYTRTTRLESVLLGFIRSKSELQALKKGLVRSNTRSVYVDDADDQWIADHPEIQRLAGEIEARRVELGKTSGFERMYHRVTRQYFGGVARHLANLRPVLRPGARLAYVVGDQASYLRVMIRTGELLADLAGRLGYEVTGIDLFRTRLATATGEQLREEVVLLRWPGPSR